MNARLASLSLPLLAGSLLSEPGLASDYLLLETELDNGCKVSAWDPTTLESRKLGDLEECAERLFGSAAHASAFYLDGGKIIQVSIRGEFEPKAIARVPELTLESLAEEAFSRPLSDYEKMTASQVMPVRNIGMFMDGTPWMHAGLVMAGDDDYDFLFRLVDNEWRFEEFVHCGRFEACEFKTLTKEKPGHSGDEVAPEIWDKKISENPYHIRDEHAPPVDTGYRSMAKIDRYFRIDDQDVMLEVWTGEGPDSGYPYTGGAVLHYAGGDSLVICETQCTATLTGRYLLAERYWGGTLEIYDMATGESVLGPLKYAFWLRVPGDASPD